MMTNNIIKDDKFSGSLKVLELDEVNDENPNSIFNTKIFGSRNLILDTNDLSLINDKLFYDDSDVDIFNTDLFELKGFTTKSKPLFSVEEIHKKRGRKNQKICNKKIHLDSSKDNITSKIQVHFLNFVINAINDHIYFFTKNEALNFKKFDHSEKSKVSKSHIDKVKSWNIYDLLENMNISNKYKRCEKNNNKIIRDELNVFPWFQQLSKVNIETLFNIYYNNKLPLEKINLIGKEIILSNKTKGFYDLLMKNKKLEEFIVETVEDVYIKKKDKEKK